MYILPEQKNKYIENMMEKYSDMVYKLAYTRAKTRENADDIYQDVFLAFSKALPEFDTVEHEKAWFIRVTINKSKNFLNSFWNRNIDLSDEDIKFETAEDKGILEEVLKLPQNYKTVIYLHYYEGYKISEIATLLNKNESTIKTWMSRARTILEENIKGGFENE